MTSRDRVLLALNHRCPDRVPIDFGGHRSSGISAMGYARLKRALGIEQGHIHVYDMVQQLAVVEPAVLDVLSVDVVEMGRGFCTQCEDWQDWMLPDGTPCKIPAYLNIERRGDEWLLLNDEGLVLGVQKPGCIYFEQTLFPLAERTIEGDDFHDLAEQIPRNIWAGVPHPGAHLPLDAGGRKRLERGAKALRASTDRAIIGLFGGNMFELPQWLYGMEQYLGAMALHPRKIMELSETLCHLHLQNLELWLGAVGPHIDVILFGDDLGSQTGPLMSPEMYRQYYKPFHATLWQRAKELADVKVMLHCCGGVRELLPDLIDAGLDAINPVQVSSRGMDAAALKRDFGKDLTFWGGGCDTHRVLPNATPERIRAHVREQVNALSPDGGFVFQQVHNIQPDVPTENILAMFEAIHG